MNRIQLRLASQDRLVPARPGRAGRAGRAGRIRLAAMLATSAVLAGGGPAWSAAPVVPPAAAPPAISPVDGAAHLAGTVRLRHAVRLAPGAQLVRLRDVARLDASLVPLADVPVASLADAAGPVTVTTGAVREALAAAGGHPARLLVHGTDVRVHPGIEDAAADRPVAMSAIRIERGGDVITGPAAVGPGERAADRAARRTVPAAVALPGQDVLAAATHRLLTALDVSPERLRIAVREEDVDWLRRPMTAVHLRLLDEADDARVRLEIRPRPTTSAVRPVEGGRVVVLEPQLRVERARTTEAIDRGRTIEPAMIETEAEWASPRVAALAMSRDAVIGLEADRRLPAGRVLGPGDVQRPVVVRRGDELVVRSGADGFQLRMAVIARDDGRLGDRIRVRHPGHDGELTVVVVAPGLVEPAAPEPLGPVHAVRTDRVARRR